MAKFTLSINQQKHTVTVAPDTPLLWVLRDHLHLVGTKFGCGIAVCGACTVHLNGVAMRSCSLPISAIGTQEVTTIEGLSETGTHPLQVAWDEEDVAQCGYCQPGQIMTAAAFLKQKPTPKAEDIRGAMHGNICRCGSYNRIEKAVASAAKKME